jgi:hypothetical protein
MRIVLESLNEVGIPPKDGELLEYRLRLAKEFYGKEVQIVKFIHARIQTLKEFSPRNHEYLMYCAAEDAWKDDWLRVSSRTMFYLVEGRVDL